ncbi:tRNA (N6-threonylcarbamoyladenosine(37)-N6)-methyltransferase TrmO [Siccirubricoccus phaeus]|uniref:tRNA (N6-threonylcarbamoyladenosine(37)-N6)-methyltransferase TrmO n=1 Tax=Siccirubricoccus phaeus TaxID=2595053 RepID=UPI0011F1BDC0|nr:tRNA (N6-threonylcarbamoyladenosine(37)-N6)-methyltransferase TrmO [Siccirubricoccus phaeus]
MSFALRAGETVAATLPPEAAGLVFIGRIRTPWTDRAACPRQGRPDGPVCTLELFEPWASGGALDGVEAHQRLEVLYWLHLARRDLLRQVPAAEGRSYGTFALRSPLRPNPIGTSLVELLGREGAVLRVRGLDCLDGTPLLDLKPERGSFRPPAPPTPGDAETG